MARFMRFNTFIEDMGRQLHHLDKDEYKIFLTNTRPQRDRHARKSDLPEITGGNGYSLGGLPIKTEWKASPRGTMLEGKKSVLWKAAGGEIGPFQFAVLYNANAPGRPLVGFWEYDLPVVLRVNDEFEIDPGESILAFPHS